MLHKSLLMATVLFAVSSPAFAQQSPMPQAGSAPPPPQGQRQSPFERADANRDGVITLEEVRIARTAAFNRLDANRDGFLVREEMPRPPMERRGGDRARAMGPATELKATPHVVTTVSKGRIILSAADANGDGTITRAEFDAAWIQEQARDASEASARRAGMFQFLDTDRNGSISQAEVAASNGRREVWTERRHTPRSNAGMTPAGEQMGRSPHRGPLPNPDTNNDQKISLSEWLARPDPLFERGDVNKDGRVTREEAASVVRERRITVSSSKRPW